MTDISSPGGHATQYQYDPHYATLSRRRFGNSTAVYYSYDNADRVTSIRHVKADGTPIVYLDYTRDHAGRIVGISREIDLAVYYTFDAVNRLTTELWSRKSDHAQLYAFLYDYDQAHNRTKMRREFGAGAEWDSSYFAYANDNSMQRRQTNTPAPSTVNTYFYFDANGALVKQWDAGAGDATYFGYGPHKLIVAIKAPGSTATYFRYDAQLNRYGVSSPTTLYYLWDGLKLLEERDSAGGIWAQYTHGYAPNPDIGTIAEVYRPLGGTQYYQ
jgi:hypothetical protein